MQYVGRLLRTLHLLSLLILVTFYVLSMYRYPQLTVFCVDFLMSVRAIDPFFYLFTHYFETVYAKDLGPLKIGSPSE